VKQPVSQLTLDYPVLLEDLKARIRAAQTRAALMANRELIRLYWEIGRRIVERQEHEGWGKSVIERLAGDLQKEFPGLQGFSRSNIWRMRSFFLSYREEASSKRKSRTAVRDLETSDSKSSNTDLGSNLAQPVRDLDLAQPPAVLAALPWGHNVLLIGRLKQRAQRLWYAQRAIENGWSRAVLVHQIESGLHRRQGQALNNFDRVLPAPQSDLARETLKDPYIFDFLSLGDDIQERELERGLIEQVRRFLLELGAGFALVGTQYALVVDGQDFFLDLLFYHLRLRCYVVVELKVADFQPEHAGKMSFYLSAVDNLLRHPDDQPTIGLILCKTKSRMVAEYTLQGQQKPIGVASYRTLPAHLRGTLPSPREIEAGLVGVDAVN
jgi:predicted nuclease of restriction endonuclease-like (RecB) superfamily